MSEWIKLKANDGHELSAYVARPDGQLIGSLVLIQEVYGVNAYMRSVADGYARDGFLVVAPALFDRVKRGVELKYEGEDQQRAFALYGKLNTELSLLDVAAGYDYAKKAEKVVGVIGFCYGGLISWLAAIRGEALKMHPSCCVAYYPGNIGNYASEEPSCPVMLHFGAEDTHVGQDQVEAVRSAHPEVEIFVYEGAGHAFSNDFRESYHAASAAAARERSLAFLKKHIA
jgi:carboxymethylenebutenolidase